MWYDCESVFVKGGTVELIAHDKKHTMEYWDGNTYMPSVACGVMRSVETFGYGTFSSDIILPQGRNLWPSFWLVGDGPWPNNGEIDIMEAWSNKKGSYYRFPLGWRTTTNVHYLEGVHRQTGSKNVSILKQPKKPSDRLVRYEVEWRPNKIIFRVDGKVIREVGWEVTKHFVGVSMNVIFSVKTSSEHYTFETPMIIKDFRYEPL